MSLSYQSEAHTSRESSAQQFPLIVFQNDGMPDDGFAQFVKQTTLTLDPDNYCINTREWQHTAHVAIGELLGHQVSIHGEPFDMNATIATKRKAATTFVALHADEDQHPAFLRDADAIISCMKDGICLRIKNGECFQFSVSDNSVITQLTSSFPSLAHKSPMKAEENTHQYSIHFNALAENIDLKKENSRFIWTKDGVEAAIKVLQAQCHDTTVPILLSGGAPAFLYSAITIAFLDRAILINDDKVPEKSVHIPLSEQRLPDSADPLRYSLEDRGEYSLISIDIPTGITFSSEVLQNIHGPDIPLGKGVVLSGKLPITVFATLARQYAKRNSSWVAILTPQQSQDAQLLSPALMLTGNKINYIDVFPSYYETFPFHYLADTFSFLSRQCVSSQKGLPEDLSSIESIRTNLLNLARENPTASMEKFRLYAHLSQEMHILVRELSASLQEYSVDEQDVIIDVLIQCLKLLSEPSTDIHYIQERASGISVFSMIVRSAIAETKRKISIDEIPSMHVRKQDAVGIESSSLFQKIKEFYTLSYGHDMEHGRKLLQNFPLYCTANLQPNLYLLEKKQGSTESLQAFVRFSNVTPIDPQQRYETSKKYRYAGGLNMHPSLQGSDLYFPFLRWCITEEFNEGASAIFLRADRKRSLFFQRIFGAEIVDTSVTLENEFPSGDDSNILILRKEAFEAVMEKIS